MHIVAILIGIINPLFSTPLFLLDYWQRRKPVFSAFMLALVMGYIAFYAESKYIGDLERYMEMLSSYRDIPFIQCFDRIYSRLYVMDIIFWLCAKFSNPRMFVSVAAFILYFIVFYITFDFSKQSSLGKDNSRFLFLILVFMLPFYYFLSSTRSSLALIVGILAIYQDVYKNNKKPLVFILYVIPIMIHQASVVILLLRLLWFLPEKTRKIVTGIVIVLILMMGLGVFNFAEGLIGYDLNFLTDALNKAIGYSAYGTEQYSIWQTNLRNGLYSQTLKLYYAVVLVFIIIPNNNSEVESDRNIIKFTRSAALLVLALMFYPTGLYLRFVTGFCVFIVITAYIKYKSKLGSFLLITASAGLLLQMYSLFEAVPYKPFLIRLSLGIFNVL